MHRTGGRFDHDCFACAKVLNPEDAISLNFEVLGKAAVKRHPIRLKVFAEQAVPAFAVETVSAGGVAVGNYPLARFKPGYLGPELDDFAGELVPGDQRKTRTKLPYVNMEIGPAKTTGMHSYQHLIGVDLRVRSIAIGE